jgi:cellulose synthase (UDP-forming)
VTEDYLVTLKMKAAGFRTVYLNERLSLGLAPRG